MEGTASPPATFPAEEAVPAQGIGLAWRSVAAMPEGVAVEAADDIEAQSLFSSDGATRLPRKRGRPKKASNTEPTSGFSCSPNTSALSAGSSTQACALAQQRTTSTAALGTEISVDLQGPLVPQAKKGRLAYSPLHDAMLHAALLGFSGL